MYQIAQAPRSISKIISSSIQLYKKSFEKGWFLFLLLAFSAALSTLPLFFPVGSPVLIQSPITPAKLFVSILSFFLLIYFQAMLICLFDKIGKDQYSGYKAIAFFSLKKYLIIVGSTVVVFFLIGAGMLLFIFPGLYLAVLLMYPIFSILLDGDGVFSSIKRSAKIVWGKWWRTLIILFIATLIMAGGELIFWWISVHLFHLAKHQWSYFIINLIPSFFLTPWLIAVLLEQYYDLKMRYQLKQTQQQ